MCGRYVLAIPLEELGGFFELSETRLTYTPRYNIAPTASIAVVRRAGSGAREAVEMRWGWIPPRGEPADRRPRLINARSETVATRPVFRSAFAQRRCLVPASGFFEWGTCRKQPFYIRRKDGCPAALAGIWEQGAEGVLSAVILTMPATEGMRAIHERMPLEVPRVHWTDWLQPAPLDREAFSRIRLEAASIDRRIITVSARVNSARNDDPSLIEAVPPPIPLI